MELRLFFAPTFDNKSNVSVDNFMKTNVIDDFRKETSNLYDDRSNHHKGYKAKRSKSVTNPEAYSLEGMSQVWMILK